MRAVIFLLSICVVIAVKYPETTATTQEFILNQGLLSEDFYINKQGYPLSINRLRKVGGQPVILQHGLLDTTATWVINARDNSLGFMLFDAGYDVWMLNGRGNSYSGPGPSWDWTFQDQADDVISAVNYITKYTNTTPILIAHSQGSTMSLIALARSSAPRLKLFVALAPVTFLTHQKSPLFKLMSLVHADLPLLLANCAFQPTKIILDRIFGVLCAATPSLCNFGLEGLFGPDDKLNATRMGIYTAHWPDVTSTKNMVHWIRNARSGDFADFSGKPFDLSPVKVPTVVYAGSDDSLASPLDVQTLVKKLGNNVKSSKMIQGFAHMDFVWSETAAKLVYRDLLDQLKKYI